MPSSAKLHVRRYIKKDFAELMEIQRECFLPPYPADQLWNEAQLESHIRIFPQGALCVEANGQLVGSCTSLIIKWDPQQLTHSWVEITDNGYIRNHDAAGNTLYGVDMAVRPAWRRKGVAKLMYQARFSLVKKLGLSRFMAAGRISGYHRYQHKMTPDDYVKNVVANKMTDPVLTSQLRAELTPVSIVQNYLFDEESANCALLLEWANPDLLRAL